VTRHRERDARNRFKASQTPAERFWSKVDRTGECWLWTAGVDKDRYGKYTDENHRSRRAHHVAWELSGHAPATLLMHSCDNRRCVRPKHLVPGTQAQNIADKVAKNRQARGERHPRARLTERDVVRIRELAKAGAATAEIARRFGVSPACIFLAVARRNWRHVP